MIGKGVPKRNEVVQSFQSSFLCENIYFPPTCLKTGFLKSSHCPVVLCINLYLLILTEKEVYFTPIWGFSRFWVGQYLEI